MNTCRIFLIAILIAITWTAVQAQSKDGIVGGVVGGAPTTPPAPPPPPPPPPKESKTAPKQKQVDGSVQERKLIHRVSPVYPPKAKEAKIQGAVRLSAVIATDGTIKDLKAISGHQLLVPAAIDAVKQWKYQPASENDKPVEVITQITLTFTLAN